MKHATLDGLQRRHANREKGRPYAIEPGFEAPGPRTCQYIAGEPSADDSCKCSLPAVPGGSYCVLHQAVCYVPPAEVRPGDVRLRGSL